MREQELTVILILLTDTTMQLRTGWVQREIKAATPRAALKSVC